MPAWECSSSASGAGQPFSTASRKPVQRADARIAAPGEHQLGGAAHADQLVVDEIGRHAHQVRPRRRWRMISCPAANGIRCVNPSSATPSPSATNCSRPRLAGSGTALQRSLHHGARLLTQVLCEVVERRDRLAGRARTLPATERLIAWPGAGGRALRPVRVGDARLDVLVEPRHLVGAAIEAGGESRCPSRSRDASPPRDRARGAAAGSAGTSPAAIAGARPAPPPAPARRSSPRASPPSRSCAPAGEHPRAAGLQFGQRSARSSRRRAAFITGPSQCSRRVGSPTRMAATWRRRRSISASATRARRTGATMRSTSGRPCRRPSARCRPPPRRGRRVAVTMQGFLPPISAMQGAARRRRPSAAAACVPTATEPVKVMPAIAGWPTNAAPTSAPEPDR